MTPFLADADCTLYHGDCLDVLAGLPSGSVHMCATSPPFFGLRDYGTGAWEGGDEGCDHKHGRERPAASTLTGGTGTIMESEGVYRSTCGKCGARRVDRQIGLEDSPDEWVARLVAVFREVRRVLRDDGTLWVEIGDSYSSSPRGNIDWESSGLHGAQSSRGTETLNQSAGQKRDTSRLPGVKPKDLLGQPWLLAFALRADGWYLRSEIIWSRPNPMPESVSDRPTKAHSTVFLLSKRPRYFMDMDAIREKDCGHNGTRPLRPDTEGVILERKTEPHGGLAKTWEAGSGANARSVWQIPGGTEWVRLRPDLSEDDRSAVLDALRERGLLGGT